MPARRTPRWTPAEIATLRECWDGDGVRAAQDRLPGRSVWAINVKALPVGEIAAKDACLAMWLVGSHCDAALDLARAWGNETGKFDDVQPANGGDSHGKQ